MKRIILIISVVLLFTGCASMSKSKDTWFALKQTDEFTDKMTCMVTAGDVYKWKGAHYNASGVLPYIEMKNGELRLGLRRGGRLKAPLGDVQLRVDKHDAWVISTAETPIDAMPTNPAFAAMQGNPHAQKAYDTTMSAMTRSMSPYTTATGEKAEKILAQMLNGEIVKFRTFGFNKATSTTGHVVLDASLPKALAECGVSVPGMTPESA